MRFRQSICVLAVLAAMSGGAVAADADAVAPEQTADLSKLTSRPGGALFPVETILNSLSDELGLSFIFDSRIISDKTIKPIDPDRDSEKELKRELGAIDLELHRVAKNTYAITEAEPAVFAPPAENSYWSAPDPIDTIVVMASMPLASETAGSKRLFKLDSDDLAYLNATSVAEAIYDLPQSLASFTPSNTALFGSAAGISLADLRGLEPKRTMVLVNGRRGALTSGGNSDIGGFDLNSIAEPFIERIEVSNLPGGARYGSAAVAGAINFVTKSNLEGVEAGMKAGISERGDAETLSLYAIAGRTFGDFGNITIGIDATRVEGLIGADRPFSATPYGFALNGVRSSSPDAMFLPDFGGSSATGDGQFSAVILDNGELRSFDDNALWIPQSNGSLEQYVGAADQLFNWSAWQSVTLPNDRLLGQLAYNSEFADRWRFSIEYRGGVSATDGQLAPLPAFRQRGSQPVTGDAAVISLDNPTLPQSIRDLAIAEFGISARAVVFDQRYVELGPRRIRVDRRYSDLAVGVELENESGAEFVFTYRLDGNRTVAKERDRVDLAKLQTALDPALCAATAGCADVDFFSTPSISSAALDFIRTPQISNIVKTREHELSAALSTPVRFNNDTEGRFSAGIELRRSTYETKDLTPPGVMPVGTVFSGNQRNIEKTIDAFAIVDTPVFRNADYLGSADASLAARISQSSASGTAMNFEGGVEWRPIKGVSLFTRQFVGSRAPNIIELFSVGGTLESFFFDPCSQSFIGLSATIAENCANPGPLGVNPGFQQTAVLASTTEFGNSELEPEKIHSQSYGLSITPTDLTTIIPGRLQLTATWLDFEILEAVSATNDALFACYLSVNLSSSHCGDNPRTGEPLIRRDPISQQIVSYDFLRTNDGELHWRGLDLEARYSTKPALIPFFDSIWVSALHTYTDRVLINLDGENLSRLEGLIRFPKQRTLVSFGAEVGNWSFVAYGNRRGRVRNIDTDRVEAYVPAALYLDFTARFDVTDRAYIQANVQNITDYKPKITAFGQFGNFAPEFYDPIGRRYSIGFRLNF